MIRENVDLKKYNSYGIGGTTKYFITPESEEELLDSLEFVNKNNIPYQILGGGTNVILPDEDYNGAIIRLSNKDFKVIDDRVYVGSGMMLTELISKLLDLGFTNMASLYGIPGTVGGALIGNAGAYGSFIYDDLVCLRVMDEHHNFKEIMKDDISFGYRDTEFKNSSKIITSAVFRLIPGDTKKAREDIKKNLAERRAKQPLEYKNAGSVFKNPPGMYAGAIITKCGLKELRVGDAEVSDKHANFIINRGNATSKDIKELIAIIRKEVKYKKNIELELEQVIIEW